MRSIFTKFGDFLNTLKVEYDKMQYKISDRLYLIDLYKYLDEKISDNIYRISVNFAEKNDR